MEALNDKILEWLKGIFEKCKLHDVCIKFLEKTGVLGLLLKLYNKSKAILLFLIIFVVIVFFWIIWVIFDSGIKFAKSGLGISSTVTEFNNPDELEQAITVNQANYSIGIWGSDEDGDYSDDQMNMQISPMLNIQVNDSSIIESVSVKNLNASSLPGDSRLVRSFPNHSVLRSASCSGFFYEGCDNNLKASESTDKGSDFSYKIVDSYDNQVYWDEIYGSSILPSFKIAFIGITPIDGAGIYERDGSYSGFNILKYSGLESSELTTTVEFDIVIGTTLGDWGKHFTIDVTADEIYGTGGSNLKIDSVK